MEKETRLSEKVKQQELSLVYDIQMLKLSGQML